MILKGKILSKVRKNKANNHYMIYLFKEDVEEMGISPGDTMVISKIKEA